MMIQALEASITGTLLSLQRKSCSSDPSWPLHKGDISSFLPGAKPLSQGHSHSVRNSWVLMSREKAKEVALVVQKALLRKGVR